LKEANTPNYILIYVLDCALNTIYTKKSKKMKKKIFGAVVVVAIAVGAMINVNLNHSNKYSALTFESIESLAGESFCIGDPTKNAGKCASLVNGNGASCINASKEETKDCWGTAEMMGMK